MSEPKPMQLAHVEDSQETPEWIDAANRNASSDISPLLLPEIEVDSISGATNMGRQPTMDVPQSPLSMKPANSNSMRPQSEIPLGSATSSTANNQAVQPDPAINELKEELQYQIVEFATAAADLAVARQEALSTVEGELLELAIHIAQAIVEQEIVERPELHMALARAAIDSIEQETTAVLRAGTTAAAVLRDHFGADEFEVNGIRLRLVEESSLSELGCLIDTSSSRIDGRLSQRLASVRRAFDAERRRRMEEAS